MPDETEDELRERINQKLDIDVEVTDIYIDLEEDGEGVSQIKSGQVAGAGGKSKGTQAVSVTESAGGWSALLGNRNKLLYIVLRFVLIAVVAIVLPLVFNNKKDGGAEKK